jgi:hypothetical protein
VLCPLNELRAKAANIGDGPCGHCGHQVAIASDGGLSLMNWFQPPALDDL